MIRLHFVQSRMSLIKRLFVALQEYEKLHEIEEAGGDPSANKKRSGVNVGYGPITLVVTTMVAMTVGALVSRSLNRRK